MTQAASATMSTTIPPAAIMRCDSDMLLARSTATRPQAPIGSYRADNNEREDHAWWEMHPASLHLTRSGEGWPVARLLRASPSWQERPGAGLLDAWACSKRILRLLGGFLHGLASIQ